ncbi:MAG TPA: secretin N-terminal domain-containing protein [Caulobacteraceae bacterium]|nr:secretin N-terminal domain-containing protein [Caulobacteraceae bacterium]
MITAVTPSEPSPAESRVMLSFGQLAPQFSIMANDSNTVTIAFAETRLAPALTFPGGKHGLIQSMNFVQNDSLLILTISGAGPIHLAATTLAGRAVALAVTPYGATAAATPDLGPAPLSAHADGGFDDVFEVVPLKYADVSEVVGILTTNQAVKPNDNFTPQEPAFGSAGMQGGLGTPTFNAGINVPTGAGDPYGQAVDDTIAIDRRLNAIILRGAPDKVARLKSEILKLDVPVESVVLETVFVELTESGARDIGLNFNNANGQAAYVAYSFGAGNSSGSGTGSGFDTARWGAVAANLQAAVYAEIAKGQGRIISKPRIAAQSGGTAKIITGDALPILTSIALSGVNAVQQQVQYVNVGVTLQIAPRVTDDGFVTSHVFAEVSSVTGYSQGYPTISQREASTSATVKDGQAFVIGGLTQDSDLRNHQKVPLAGDVPLLGELFKVENSSRSKTELFIVVTPHIVRPGDHVDAAVLEHLQAAH